MYELCMVELSSTRPFLVQSEPEHNMEKQDPLWGDVKLQCICNK